MNGKSAEAPIALNALRLVHAALMSGVVMLGVVFVALAAGSPPQYDERMGLVLFGVNLALGVGLAAVQGFVRRAAINGTRRAAAATPSDAATRREVARSATRGEAAEGGAAPAAVQAYATQSITRAAMAEGFALFGLVVFYLTHAWYALIAPAIGLAALLLLFPTETKRDAFVREARGPE